MTIICIVFVILTALIGITVFSVQSFWPVLTAVCSSIALIGMIVFMICRKKKAAHLIGVLGSVAGVLLLFGTAPEQKEGGLYTYREKIEKAESLARKGKDEAEKKLAELEEKYKTTDEILKIYVEFALAKGDLWEAKKYAGRMKDQTSIERYLCQEAIYLAEQSYSMKEDLYRLYQEAGENRPDWAYGQKMAGIAAYEQNKYTAASYFLIRAAELDGTDAESFYYLGVIDYETGNREGAVVYFANAYGCDPDKSMKSRILWYLEELR